MKHLLLFISLVVFPLSQIFAQQMHVKQPNFTSFYEDKKQIVPLLLERSTRQAVTHPEFGVQPFNAQCSECVELIDKRTVDSRQFIDPKDAGHTYSQKSYFPLHYKKSDNDIWRTIDFRLKPDATQPGVYEAKNQPVPTKCDLNRRSTTLDVEEFQFEFNQNLSMYFFDEQTVYTANESGNYANHTIGQEGLLVKNIWSGIDMQQIFRTGEIKTNYVINAPLQLPISKGWMVIEDHFTLPDGYSFEESKEGKQMKEGRYQGDYLLKNKESETLIVYEKPVYLDAKAWGQHGEYKLLKNGGDYTLQIFVPVEWLTNPNNTYPLMIDPIVSGITKLGSFRSENFVSANMGFSTKPASCDYKMSNNLPTSQPVVVPGMSTLTNAYVDLEYQLTYDNTCGSPPLSSPFCTFSQVSMEVVNDNCGTSTGLLGCSPGKPPYTGTCTTDSLTAPSAGSIHINNINPNFLSCIPAQCADYELNFTLKNQDSICGNACGYLCARGNIWQMTVEAQSFTDFEITRDTFACYGDTVRFSLNNISGPVPYQYVWDYGNEVDTTTSPMLVFVAKEPTSVRCWVYTSFCSNSPYFNTYIGYLNMRRAEGNFYFTGDSLKCKSEAPYYIWYRDDTIISGANKKWYIPTSIGRYAVQTIDSFGCKSALSYEWDIKCEADFRAYLYDEDSATYHYSNYSSGINLTYLWYFDDGDTSSLTNPVHIYSDSGLHYQCLTISNLFCSDTYCDSTSKTGIADLISVRHITIYPNPTTEELFIQTSNFHPTSITIYDVNGRIVQEEKFTPRIQIGSIQSGIYFIEVKGFEGAVRKKVIKL